MFRRLAAALVITALCGLPLKADSPQVFFNSALVATVTNIKNTSGSVYGFSIGNVAGTICYLQIFNATAANVTLGTTTPVLSILANINTATIGATTALSFSNSPVPFNAAISVAATTLPTNATPCGTGLVVNILYL